MGAWEHGSRLSSSPGGRAWLSRARCTHRSGALLRAEGTAAGKDDTEKVLLSISIWYSSQDIFYSLCPISAKET